MSDVKNPKHKGPHCIGYCEGNAYQKEIERLTFLVTQLDVTNSGQHRRIAKLEGEVDQFKKRLPDDYLTQLEFAQQENKRLNAQLEATEANEQVLVDANKPLLDRIAKLEGAGHELLDGPLRFSSHGAVKMMIDLLKEAK